MSAYLLGLATLPALAVLIALALLVAVALDSKRGRRRGCIFCAKWSKTSRPALAWIWRQWHTKIACPVVRGRENYRKERGRRSKYFAALPPDDRAELRRRAREALHGPPVSLQDLLKGGSNA